MTEDLVARIKNAYPTGLIYYLDEKAIESDEQRSRLQNALNKIMLKLHLTFCVKYFEPRIHEIIITQKEVPGFNIWQSLKMILRIKVKQVYPVFKLKVSRIADYYCYYIPPLPLSKIGDHDYEYNQEQNALWVGYESAIRNTLEENGFKYIDDGLALEKVPFVLNQDSDSIPDDDPRWNDDEFTPPLVPCTVYKLLFRL